jgi:sigma-B regulation protein RsbU (phosphoserine phosphatase)
VPVPAEDPRWDASVDRKTGFRTRNILAAPVMSVTDRRLLGVLQLLNKAGGFTPLDERLVQAFAAHVALAIERGHWEEQARAAEALRQSLEMGRRIQSGFLPSTLPQIPGYEVAVWWQPAEFVSGDYYDWLPLEHGGWGFVIGDVSGHGLAAALVMASVRAMVRVLSETETDPRQLVELVRESVRADLHDGRFVTFLCVMLDPTAHRATLWNAGHGPAYRLRAADGSAERLIPTATPLGFPSVINTGAAPEMNLMPGDLLMLGTDGVIEVSNGSGEMFGVERLLETIRQHRTEPAERIVAAVADRVQRFHGLRAPPDDTTLVIIRRG